MTAAAIFDLDGTLVTFNLDIRGWRKVLIDMVKSRGFDTEGLDLATPTQQILDSVKSQVAPNDAERFEDLRVEAFRTLDSMELEGAASASILPGAEGVLRHLKSKGVRLCVVTNSGRAASSQILKKTGLLSHFEFVLTRDDTETMKPRPEGLTKAVSLLRIPPRDVYYVGDSPYDIRAAKNAGVKAVSVATGNYAAERLRSEGADFVMESLTELPGVIGV